MDTSPVYVGAWALGCFHSHINTQTFRRALTASVDSCRRGDKECPFSEWRHVSKSGRVWRKVPESDAPRSVCVCVCVCGERGALPGPCIRLNGPSLTGLGSDTDWTVVSALSPRVPSLSPTLPASLSGTLLQRTDAVNQCLEFVSRPAHHAVSGAGRGHFATRRAACSLGAVSSAQW